MFEIANRTVWLAGHDYLGLGEVVRDEEIALVELDEGRLEGGFASYRLKLLHDVAGASV